MHCEPGSVAREAMAMASFTSMVTKRAKNYAETGKMMTEFDERAKRVEETTGKKPDERHAISVLVGTLDFETLKHTSAHQGAALPVEVLKRKAPEFANVKVNPNAMSIDRVERSKVTIRAMSRRDRRRERKSGSGQHGEEEKKSGAS